ncbi:hypothetical protein H7U19_16695 [Hyunsoonleella sp. SJ7]|uniref:Uncharacterized protein n=1 Tax=Hyunsoonleella aquatilis TaxID=2762758 RepID=A0A923HGT9_9FLAO|nr:hypothetical protein [Hyunsoonleella aquatilis]MBC3760048.1 hypothetical protein [Hyunsoonleella aquatilis]
MTLINKFQIDRTVNTTKSESELANSIKRFDHKRIDVGNGIITIYGKAFYDFVCEIKPSKVRLTAKPKKILLIFVLTFLTFWTIGFMYQNGILIGIILSAIFIIFGAFVHKKMMELNLDEISELIKNE